ncbi:hypothetical protein VPH35_024986 [Triticum aestivum]
MPMPVPRRRPLDKLCPITCARGSHGGAPLAATLLTPAVAAALAMACSASLSAARRPSSHASGCSLPTLVDFYTAGQERRAAKSRGQLDQRAALALLLEDV